MDKTAHRHVGSFIASGAEFHHVQLRAVGQRFPHSGLAGSSDIALIYISVAGHRRIHPADAYALSARATFQSGV